MNFDCFSFSIKFKFLFNSDKIVLMFPEFDNMEIWEFFTSFNNISSDDLLHNKASAFEYLDGYA